MTKYNSLLTPIIASLFLLSLAPAQAEPMLDTDLLSITRTAAAAGVQDGLFDKEAATEERALKITQEKYGPVHPALVPVLNDLATLQRHCAQYQKALANYKWGLAILEKVLGPDDPKVAESLDDLAGVETDMGHYSDAELDYNRATSIQEKAAENDPLAVVPSLFGQGQLYAIENRDNDALPLLKRLVDIQIKILGRSDLRLVPSLELRAKAEASTNPNDAESDLKWALGIRQKKLPTGSPDITRTSVLLADFYRTHGKTDEANQLYQQAAVDLSKFLGENDYRSVRTLHLAAQIDFALGQYKKSAALLNRVLKIRTATYGADHPLVALCLEDLAAVQEKDQQPSKAQENLKKAKNILEKTFDPTHPEVLNIEKKLKALSK